MTAQGGRAGVESELCFSIRKRLDEILANLILETQLDGKGDGRTTVSVFNGYLPPTRQTPESEVPFVIVRPSKGSSSQDGFTTVEVNLIVVTYSKDFDGHENGLQVLARIRQGLLARPTLDQRYRMQPKFDWALLDEQPYPNWQILIKTEWVIPTPQNIENEGDY